MTQGLNETEIQASTRTQVPIKDQWFLPNIGHPLLHLYMGQITWCPGIHYAWMLIPYKPMNDLSETYPKIIQAYAYAPHQNGDVDV